MGTRDVFSKVLPNIKLATRFDADGKEIQVNILDPLNSEDRVLCS